MTGPLYAALPEASIIGVLAPSHTMTRRFWPLCLFEDVLATIPNAYNKLPRDPRMHVDTTLRRVLAGDQLVLVPAPARQACKLALTVSLLPPRLLPSQ